MHPVAIVSLVDSQPPTQKQISVNAARTRIRDNRAVADEVRVYETTDRNGTGLHIAYVHYGPGIWATADDVTYVFEIPTEALTSL
jgi:hypothetical protein